MNQQAKLYLLYLKHNKNKAFHWKPARFVCENFSYNYELDFLRGRKSQIRELNES